MDAKTNQILFSLLRSSIGGAGLTEEERALLTPDRLPRLGAIAKTHDVAHLLALGLQQNGFAGGAALTKSIFEAVYRSEQRERDLENICAALTKAQIPFMPLKGAILCRYYPEPWLRTSCDIDVLVHREDLNRAASALVEMLGYEEKERSTHDVSLFSPEGNHVELHFDLIEEGGVNNAKGILQSVWEHAVQKDGGYRYEMTDAYFYFYHVAHMAKHFQVGGCGIRPFIDLFILDALDGINEDERNALLEAGNLLHFAEAARALSKVWLGGEKPDARSLALEGYILQGGVYGTADNRVLLHQKKRGGRLGYILSRMFLPYNRLKIYYPVLEKHRWLFLFMQLRRWFMLLNPRVAKMARRELAANRTLDQQKATEMQTLLQELGL